MNDKIKHYPKTDLFEVIDTIGVPHTFTIGTKHVVHASDHFSGSLSEAAIQSLEKGNKPSCKHPGCNLMYKQHEQALLVKCKSKDNDLMRAYLVSIKDRCETDGFAGFTFLDGTKSI